MVQLLTTEKPAMFAAEGKGDQTVLEQPLEITCGPHLCIWLLGVAWL